MSTDTRFTTLEHAMAELAVAQARTDANIDHVSANVARTSANIDRVSANVDRATANVERLSEEMRAFKEEMGAFKEEMRAFKEEMGAFKEEMRASRKDADKRWGELANKMGTLAEDIVAPSIPELFQKLFGVEDPDSYVRVKRRHRADRSRRGEFDVVAWGGEHFLATEVRSEPSPEDLPRLLSRFREIRDFFPEAAGLKVVGALASFYIDPSLVRAAERNGLLEFGLASGLLEPLNTPGFKPTEF